MMLTKASTQVSRFGGKYEAVAYVTTLREVWQAIKKPSPPPLLPFHIMPPSLFDAGGVYLCSICLFQQATTRGHEAAWEKI